MVIEYEVIKIYGKKNDGEGREKLKREKESKLRKNYQRRISGREKKCHIFQLFIYSTLKKRRVQI